MQKDAWEGTPVVLEPLVASAEPLNAQLWPNNFHKIVQNRLALLGKQSVSVGHRRHPLSDNQETHPCVSISSAMTE